MIWMLSALALGADPLMEEVFSHLAQAQTVQSSFTQTQHRQVLARPLVSRGSLVFARPDKLRWQVDTPARAIFVMDGPSFTTAMPDLGTVEQVSLAGQPELLGLVEGLTVWLQADLAAVQRDYDASWQDGLLVLEPKKDALSRWVKRFTLTLSSDHSEVVQVALTEPDGDRVVLAFTDVKRGAPIAPQTFQLK